jgi:transposase InsO family protein
LGTRTSDISFPPVKQSSQVRLKKTGPDKHGISPRFFGWVKAFLGDTAYIPSRPGKPVQNAFAESLIGRFRDECLDEHLFPGWPATRWIVETWRADYNAHRPHTSLRGLT